MIDSTDDYFAIFMRSNCCRSGNVREVLTCLIFANLARMTNSRIQEYRKNNYNNSAIKEKKNLRILNFVKSPKIRNLRKFKHTKIPDVQYLSNIL